MRLTLEGFSITVCVGAVGLIGILLFGFGQEIGLTLHGALILFAFAAAAKALLDRVDPQVEVQPTLEYRDDVIKWGVLACVIWAVVGFFVGDLLAWQLAIPALNGDLAWLNFGRLRPVHTTAVIFGFGGNALMATSFYVMQRTSRARMPDGLLAPFVLGGYNLFVLLAVTGYPLGITQGKEYAEPEWYADLILLITWVGYLTLYLRTLARRAEPHIYVANWYYL